MSDWDQRQLCPDGGCVGVIGGDGTCSVCGRAAPNWGDERRRGLRPTGEVAPLASDDAEPDPAAGPAAADDAVAAPARAPGPDDDFDDRALCPDGGCIGVIGADGHCNVCGKTLDDEEGE